MRMKAVASLVTPGKSLADVGCDHGYLPIHLVREGIVPSAIAMDVNKGPLESAEKHILESGLADRITVRLSDGLKELKAGEAESVTIAGMGGRLMIRLVEESVLREDMEISEYILQPQSDLPHFRKKMEELGLLVMEEKALYEDGKYYTVGRYIPSYRGYAALMFDLMAGCEADIDTETAKKLHRTYGGRLLTGKDQALHTYLKKETETLKEIRNRIEKESSSEKSKGRLTRLENQERLNMLALSFYQ